MAKYVNYLYPKKSESQDPVETSLIKLLLNSLYGKFGQNRFYENEVYSFDYHNFLGI